MDAALYLHKNNHISPKIFFLCLLAHVVSTLALKGLKY